MTIKMADVLKVIQKNRNKKLKYQCVILKKKTQNKKQF